MSDTPNIDELRKLATELKWLLDETWNELYATTVSKMLAFWGHGTGCIDPKRF